MSTLSRTVRALCYLAFRNDPVARRHRADWLASLRRPDPLVYGKPWITYTAIEWAEQHIRPDMRIFEWGSGGSTVFWARRAASVVAVEHDEQWASRVSSALAAQNLANAHCHHVATPAMRAGAADSSFVHRAKHATLDCRDYVQFIDRFDDASLDLIVVDGVCRPPCARRAIPKVRPGGYLMLDNSDRHEYDDVRTWLKELPCTEFPGITPYKTLRSRTTIWQFPADNAAGGRIADAVTTMTSGADAHG